VGKSATDEPLEAFKVMVLYARGYPSSSRNPTDNWDIGKESAVGRDAVHGCSHTCGITCGSSPETSAEVVDGVDSFRVLL